MTIDNDDMRNAPLDDLKNRANEGFDVDPDSLEFSDAMHHFSVQGRVNLLAENGVISRDRADEMYDQWLNNR